MQYLDGKINIEVSELMTFVSIVALFDLDVARRIRDVCNYQIMKTGSDKTVLTFRRDFSKTMPYSLSDDYFADDVLVFQQYLF